MVIAARRGSWPLRVPPAEREWARARLAQTGAAALIDAPLAALSGGETQRVFLARALANDPALLLLDEPTAGVDARGRAALLDLLAELAEGRRLSAVIVTHNQTAVRRLAARAVCLDRRIVASGPSASVLESTGVEGRGLGPGHDHAEPAVCEED
jgi:ABC-type Mn2+/Zn2+ transport system ATPase subunit